MSAIRSITVGLVAAAALVIAGPVTAGATPAADAPITTTGTGWGP